MPKTINKRVKDIRKALNLTQLAFANTLGLTQGGYSDMERGKSNLSGNVKLILINLHRVSLSWLEHGHGEMFVPDISSTESKSQDKNIEFLHAEIRSLHSERELYIKLLESKDKIIAALEEKLK